jgi:predicted  nucleic acid-binding Zn-ribbon protein
MRTDSILSSLEKLQGEIKEAEKENAILEGQMKEKMSNLKKHGVSSIEEAEKEIQKLEKEITNLEKEIKEQYDGLRDRYDW